MGKISIVFTGSIDEMKQAVDLLSPLQGQGHASEGLSCSCGSHDVEAGEQKRSATAVEADAGENVESKVGTAHAMGSEPPAAECEYFRQLDIMQAESNIATRSELVATMDNGLSGIKDAKIRRNIVKGLLLKIGHDYGTSKAATDKLQNRLMNLLGELQPVGAGEVKDDSKTSGQSQNTAKATEQPKDTGKEKSQAEKHGKDDIIVCGVRITDAINSVLSASKSATIDEVRKECISLLYQFSGAQLAQDLEPSDITAEARGKISRILTTSCGEGHLVRIEGKGLLPRAYLIARMWQLVTELERLEVRNVLWTTTGNGSVDDSFLTNLDKQKMVSPEKLADCICTFEAAIAKHLANLAGADDQQNGDDAFDFLA